MSQLIAVLSKGKPNLTRAKMLALQPKKKYDDGRTKQSFCDECDINLIMERAAQGGTISHLAKYEGVYADYSDYDFFKHTQMLTKGREVFDDLPAEIRREFAQNPAKFFKYMNDPENIAKANFGLPGLAKPGTQLPKTEARSADEEAALAAASEPPASEKPSTPPPEPTPDP